MCIYIAIVFFTIMFAVSGFLTGPQYGILYGIEPETSAYIGAALGGFLGFLLMAFVGGIYLAIIDTRDQMRRLVRLQELRRS